MPIGFALLELEDPLGRAAQDHARFVLGGVVEDVLDDASADAVSGFLVRIVGEVMPRDQLDKRAQELAAGLAARDHIFLRHTRSLMVQRLRKAFADLLPLGLYSAYGAALATAQVNPK